MYSLRTSVGYNTQVSGVALPSSDSNERNRSGLKLRPPSAPLSFVINTKCVLQ